MNTTLLPPQTPEEKLIPKTPDELRTTLVVLFEKKIEQKEGSYFTPEEYNRLKSKLQANDENGLAYVFHETWTNYARIAQFRQQSSEQRRTTYNWKNSRGEEQLFHVSESQQFTPEEIEEYCDTALLLKKYDEFCKQVERLTECNEQVDDALIHISQTIRHQIGTLLQGKRVMNLFTQPSSRTHRSFEAAEKMLGAEVINEKDKNMSSMAKGETGPDTIRTFTQYVDAIVMRSEQNYATEEAIFAQEHSQFPVPILNGGSGTRQHPTQALLDVMTIKEEMHLEKLSELNEKNIMIIGDALYGRTVKSLIYTISQVAPQARFTVVTPEQLQLPEKFKEHLKQKGVQFTETSDMESALPTADVLYVTRVQQEWFKKNNRMDEYNRLKDKFLVTPEHFEKLPPQAVVLHPLPRVNELSFETDQLPQSHIWDQANNGTYMRATLFATIFNKADKILK